MYCSCAWLLVVMYVLLFIAWLFVGGDVCAVDVVDVPGW